MGAYKDYYAVLGVSSTATDEEIKQAYRALARHYHPDTRDEAGSTELFYELQEVYAVLSDPLRRRAYDRQRAEMGLTAESALSWTLTLSREELPCDREEQMLYLLVEVRPGTAAVDRLPLNLCLVIDRSTSMQGPRLEQVKAAAGQIIDDLEETEALAVVAFSDRAEVVLPSHTHVDRARARAKVTTIWPSGGTEILQGIRAGLEELRKYRSDRAVSHLILLTDGHTYGDEEGCLAEARRAGQERIGITTMGIGEDWNDTLLDRIAAESGGTSTYIASSRQVQALLRQRVRGLGAICAHDLRLTPRFAQGVWLEAAFRTAPYLERLTPADGQIGLGTLYAHELVAVVLEVVVAPKKPGQHRLLQLELTAEVAAASRQQLRRDVVCRFAGNTAASFSVPVTILRALSRLTAFRMQERVWDALESGDASTASRQLKLIATRLLELGEEGLARAAMLEAGQVAQIGHLSPKGRKRLKYALGSVYCIKGMTEDD